MFFCLSSYSESPFSEHGALEEVENEGGTEAHTSEDGEWQHKNYNLQKKKKARHGNILISFEYRKFKSILNKCKHQMYVPTFYKMLFCAIHFLCPDLIL